LKKGKKTKEEEGRDPFPKNDIGRGKTIFFAYQRGRDERSGCFFKGGGNIILSKVSGGEEGQKEGWPENGRLAQAYRLGPRRLRGASGKGRKGRHLLNL